MNNEIKIYDYEELKSKSFDTSAYDLETCSINCIDKQLIKDIVSIIYNFLSNNINRYSPIKSAIKVLDIKKYIEDNLIINNNLRNNTKYIEDFIKIRHDNEKFICILFQILKEYVNTVDDPLVIDKQNFVYLVIHKYYIEEKYIYKIELDIIPGISVIRYFNTKQISEIINLTDIPYLALTLGIISNEEINRITTVGKLYSYYIATGEIYTINNNIFRYDKIVRDLFYKSNILRNGYRIPKKSIDLKDDILEVVVNKTKNIGNNEYITPSEFINILSHIDNNSCKNEDKLFTSKKITLEYNTINTIKIGIPRDEWDNMHVTDYIIQNLENYSASKEFFNNMKEDEAGCEYIKNKKYINKDNCNDSCNCEENNIDESDNRNRSEIFGECPECDEYCKCKNNPDYDCCKTCNMTENCGCYKNKSKDKNESKDSVDKTVKIPIIPEDPKTEIFMLMKLISTRVRMLSDDTTNVSIQYNCIDGEHSISIDTNTNISINTNI